MSKIIVTEVEPTAKTRKQLAAERLVGWHIYAYGGPATACRTLAMVAGWLQANRDEANACADAFLESVAMHADADALESGQRRPSFQKCQVEEMEMERPGEEFCMQPYNW